MLTFVFVTLLVLIAVTYAAVPLLVPRQVDPLPDERDSDLLDLEEERVSLFRAIRELDARDDMTEERRGALRARYEAKAATVLRAIDQRQAELAGRPAPRRTDAATTRRSLPLGTLGLLGLMAVSAVALGPFVLPRVGQDATVTTFFAEDLRAAEALRDLQRAADRDGSVPSLMRLADAYWNLQDAPEAEATYRRVLLAARDASGEAPVLAYQRLALLTFADDPATAREYLLEARRLDPSDADTLVGVAELSFQLGDLDTARDAYQAYLETPDGALDVEAASRLRLIEGLGPALAALDQERNATTLNALADVLWENGAMEQAVEVSFEILTTFDASDAPSLSRTGQLMFLRGRSDDAIELLERAAASAGGLHELDPQASLFLGNAYFSEGDDDGAVRAWSAHVTLVGEAAAGRVPELIRTAEARAGGADVEAAVPMPGATPPAGATAPDPSASAATGTSPEEQAVAALADGTPDAIAAVARGLYAQHCALCHGAEAQGASGPRLAGSSRSAQEANVRSAITFGRGIMPGFGTILSDAEIEVIVRWLAVDVATPR